MGLALPSNCFNKTMPINVNKYINMELAKISFRQLKAVGRRIETSPAQ
jgi:hypothetical protein